MSLRALLAEIRAAPQATQVVEIVSTAPATISGLEVTRAAMTKGAEYMRAQGDERITANV